LASTNEGDLVFDPFSGSGTTAVVAKELNQAFVGAELQEEFAELTIRHIGVAERGGVSRKISEQFWTGA
jgi:DNA modification methylase